MGPQIALVRSVVAEEPENAKDTRPQRRGGTWLFVPLIVVALAGGWLLRGRTAPAAQAHEGPRDKATLHLETFVLNLADPDQRSYLRVGIDLGLNRELKSGSDGAPPVARVRDTILGVLERSKLQDLLTGKGKAQLKDDIRQALQQRVPELGVEEVYYTEFLIQR